MAKQGYPKLFIKPGRERSILKGHPWLFSGAVAGCEGSPLPGEVLQAVSADGKPLAVGFYHPENNISFRCLSRDPEEVIDARFFRQKITAAVDLRKILIRGDTDAYRVINAEGDGLPGLVVDRYGRYLVISLATAGIERFRREIITILKRVLDPLAIYERSEGRARRMEGLPDRVGPAAGRQPPPLVEIKENGLLFDVDLLSGQKTGFFLDQRTNRELLAGLSRGAKVLNCFSYSGGFSLYAGVSGAAEVTSVDISPVANKLAQANWRKNGLPSRLHQVVTADVFDYLRAGEEKFDVIILDPPAFAKQLKDIATAAAGYKEINRQGAKRLKKAGLMFTFSCSNFIDESLFQKIVQGAILEAGREAKLLAKLGCGLDHPVALNHPEGRYLKGLLLAFNN